MQFPSPLIGGRLIRRYKRFLADVALDTGEVVTAVCPNTGSMLGLTEPGSRVWVSVSDNPARRYPYTWEMVEADLGRGPSLVGINTSRPNALVAEAIAAGRIAELAGYASVRREVRYGQASRIDLLLEDPSRGRCYVEIKNVHMMRRAGLAEFPDCVTARGTRHLAELGAMVAEGHRAVMLYLVQRSDARKFALAHDLDPTYAAAFEAARSAGVEALVYACRLTCDEICLDRPLPFAGRLRRRPSVSPQICERT